MSIKIPSIKQEIFKNGQLLSATDFETEQAFHVNHREFQTRSMFSPGILAGLSLSANGRQLLLSPGALIDENGSHIILSTRVKFESQPIDTQDAAFIFSLSDAKYVGKTWQVKVSSNMVASNESNHWIENFPTVELIGEHAPITDGIVIARITVEESSLQIENACPQVKLLESRLPTAKKTAKLKESLLNCFVDKPVIKEGEKVNLSWSSHESVDEIRLIYPMGEELIQVSTKDGLIVTTQSDFPVTITSTTCFTLTAISETKAIAQKQLTITVIKNSETNDINQYAKELLNNSTTIESVIPNLTNKYKLTKYTLNNAETVAGAMHAAGYPGLDTVSSIANFYKRTKDWALMVKLASNIDAPTPEAIVRYVEDSIAINTPLLWKDSYDYTEYSDYILEVLLVPVGQHFLISNVGRYPIYCLARGVFTAKPDFLHDDTWSSIVANTVLNYYMDVQGLDPERIPSSFPNIIAEATTA